jgi:hypothetical protein
MSFNLQVIESGLKPARAIALVEVDGGPKLTSSDLSRALCVTIKVAADEWERSEMEMESQVEGGECEGDERDPPQDTAAADAPLVVPPSLANGNRSLSFRNFANLGGALSHFQSKVQREVKERRKKRPLSAEAAASTNGDEEASPAKAAKPFVPLRSRKMGGQLNKEWRNKKAAKEDRLVPSIMLLSPKQPN